MAQVPVPPSLRGIGIDQHLNAAVPLQEDFHDEQGATVPLSAYFHRRPVLLVPLYYTCPNLCSQVLSGVVAGLRPLSLRPGRDFDIVAVSFNPSETSADAFQKRDLFAHRYSSRAGSAGWHFLTGSQPSIQAVMDAIGFHYRYDAASKMYIHASGVMVLTPDGRVARYLYGADFEPKDFELALVEASRGRIGTLADTILLYCYHYDPTSGKYTTTVLRVLRLAGILTLSLMAIAGIILWRIDLRYHRNRFTEVRYR
jgi:protein SCO1/2